MNLAPPLQPPSALQSGLLTCGHEEGDSELATQHPGPQVLQCAPIEWQGPTHKHIEDDAQALHPKTESSDHQSHHGAQGRAESHGQQREQLVLSGNRPALQGLAFFLLTCNNFREKYLKFPFLDSSKGPVVGRSKNSMYSLELAS